MQKRIFKILFPFLLIGCKNSLSAQLYTVEKKIEYGVTYNHSNQKEVFSLILNCTGKPWHIFTENNNQRNPIKDNWAIQWILPKSNHNNIEETGIKETSEEVWMHPPRIQKFAILEFCPFPFAKYPLTKGKRWEWELCGIGKLDSYYYKAIQQDVTDTTTVRNHYQISDKISWRYKSQDIPCYIIEAIGNTRYGITKLTSYFSPIYGFVYMKHP